MDIVTIVVDRMTRTRSVQRDLRLLRWLNVVLNLLVSFAGIAAAGRLCSKYVQCGDSGVSFATADRSRAEFKYSPIAS